MNVPANAYRNITEAEITSAFNTNDQELFFKIYDTYSPRLLGMIQKWVKEKETAEMLLCQAFTKAWRSRKFFNAERENVYYWLCRLARNCYTEYMVTEL
jgi:DNA-directed RNA polymerase specialized sigma24 family protein